MRATITFDRYDRLGPGNEQEAAQLPDDYLAAETSEQPRVSASPSSRAFP